MRYAVTHVSSLLVAAATLWSAWSATAGGQELEVLNADTSALDGDLVDPELVMPVGIWGKAPDWIRSYPGWYASSDALFLHRNRARDVKLIVDDNGTILDPNDDTPLLTGRALRFSDYEAGYRVELGRSFGNGLALEGSFFQIHEFDTAASLTSNGILNPGPDAEALSPPNFPFDQAIFNADPFFEALQQSIVYSSDILGGEMNLKATWRHHHMVRSEYFGVRYLQVRENFTLFSQDEATSTPTNGFGSYAIDTDNDLVGLQYGQELSIPVFSSVCLSSRLKAGAYVNSTEYNTRVVSNNVVAIDIRDTDANVAFVGELNVNCNVKLTKMLSARAGYNFLWVEGLALAPEQDYPGAFAGTFESNDNGGLFLHGFNVGLELVR